MLPAALAASMVFSLYLYEVPLKGCGQTRLGLKSTPVLLLLCFCCPQVKSLLGENGPTLNYQESN